MLRQFKCCFHENDTYFAHLDVVLDTWIFLEHFKVTIMTMTSLGHFFFLKASDLGVVCIMKITSLRTLLVDLYFSWAV